MKQIVDEMLEIINSVKEVRNLNGDDLSQKAVKLATLKAYIGQSVAKLDYEISMLEATRKNEWNRVFSEFRSEGKSIAESEVNSNIVVRDMIKDEIELKRKFNIVKNLRQDADSVISVIQSRLGQLKSEMVESRI